jgi:hypothetical protein
VLVSLASSNLHHQKTHFLLHVASIASRFLHVDSTHANYCAKSSSTYGLGTRDGTIPLPYSQTACLRSTQCRTASSADLPDTIRISCTACTTLAIAVQKERPCSWTPHQSIHQVVPTRLIGCRNLTLILSSALRIAVQLQATVTQLYQTTQ